MVQAFVQAPTQALTDFTDASVLRQRHCSHRVRRMTILTHLLTSVVSLNCVYFLPFVILCISSLLGIYNFSGSQVKHSLPAIRSLERKARYLFYFCCFVRFLSTISRQPAGQFTSNFACGRNLVPNVSSPLLRVGGPRRAEKGGNEIFVTMGVNGEFMHFGGF